MVAERPEILALRKIIFIFLFIIAAVTSVLFLWGTPIYQIIKDWRAQQYIDDAQEFLDEPEKYYSAIEKAHVAYNLAPNNLKIVRSIAAIYTKLNPKLALQFWNKALELSNSEFKDMKGFSHTALLLGLHILADQYIDKLLAQSPEDTDILVFKANSHYLKGNISEAAEIVSKLVDSDYLPNNFHALYFNITQKSSDKKLIESGQEYLLKLSKRSDKIGLDSIRILVTSKFLDPKNFMFITERLKTHPMANQDDFLSSLDLKLKQTGADVEIIIAEAKSYIDLKNILDLIKLSRWFNSHRFYQQTINIISDDDSLKNQDLLLVYLDALAISKHWDRIDKLLKNPSVPLKNYLKHLFKMRYYLETNNTRLSEIEWEKVVLKTSNDPDELWYVANYAFKIKLYNYASIALKKLVQDPIYMLRAYKLLLVIEYQNGNTIIIKSILKKLISQFPDDTAIINDWTYLNFLLNTNVTESFEKAKALVVENPNSLSNRVTLALGYLRMGQPKDALLVFENKLINWKVVPEKYQVVFALVLSSSNLKKEAQKFVQGVDHSKLLPEEKKLLDSILN